MAQQEATGRYTFRATVGKATTAFTDRPDRIASTVPTQTFVTMMNRNKCFLLLSIDGAFSPKQ